jgi:hypothetical protein
MLKSGQIYAQAALPPPPPTTEKEHRYQKLGGPPEPEYKSIKCHRILYTLAYYFINTNCEREEDLK